MTYSDLLKKMRDVNAEVNFSGATTEFRCEYHDRVGELGTLICTELGVNPDETQSIPLNTEFQNIELCLKFEEFKDFVDKAVKLNI